ncbi:MAG: lipid-A-disaccharide synthase [Proteobacteria bacterium]|nr:lipid-A-disaccharide synthase [Pseudomonadota bacterium]
MTAQIRPNGAYRICIVAGEASGDLLGAGLMFALKAHLPEVTFVGVGGEAMTKAGLQSLFPMSDLSVMGIVEVLPRLPLILQHMRTVLDAAKRTQIDVLVTIDSPDFSFRVAKKIHKQLGVPCIHYVSPHVWAWRKGRVRKMARFLDHVLALFPFEEDFYKNTPLACTFVGHPVVERLRHLAPSDAAKPLGTAPKVALLAGSRRSEITRLWADFAAAAVLVLKEHPGATFVVPLAPGVTPDMFPLNVPLPVQFVAGEGRYAALKSCDAALAASGTANLELAMLGVPMVVAYRLAALTYKLARPFVKVENFSPVNLVAGKRVVPELLQTEVTPQSLAALLLPLLENTDARQTQLFALAGVRDGLQVGALTPSQKAAEVVANILTGGK